MGKIRVGIIGTGFAGKFHVDCLKKVYGADVEISAVTSLQAESRERFGGNGNRSDIPAVEGNFHENRV